MAALVASILAALSRLFSTQIGRWIASALLWFGIAVAVNEVAIDPLFANIASYFSGAPADLAYALRFAALDKGMTMILSAYAVRASMAAGRAFLKRRSPAA